MLRLARRTVSFRWTDAGLGHGHCPRIRRNARTFWMCLCAAGLLLAANAGDELSSSNALSIADFQNLVSERALVIKSFRIEGAVCAVVRARKLVALQDKTAAVLLELPSIEEAIGAGDQVAVEGTHCSLIRSPFGIRVGTAPVVDHDGRHPPTLKAGRVYLEAGFQPVRLAWFNAQFTSALGLEYLGPGISRRKVPGAALWRRPAGAASASEFQPGLDFAAYNGTEWYWLPDFQK